MVWLKNVWCIQFLKRDLLIFLDGPRPNYDEIVKLRSFMLMYLKQLLLKGAGVQEDELQSILNYLSTLHEVSNYLIFLQILYGKTVKYLLLNICV